MDVGFCFRGKSWIRSVNIAVMSCRKQWEDARVECRAAKAVCAAKVFDENVDDEDKWTEDDDEETDGSRSTYRKNVWKVVVIWTNIDKEEAYKRAAEIMTADSMLWVGQCIRGELHALRR